MKKMKNLIKFLKFKQKIEKISLFVIGNII